MKEKYCAICNAMIIDNYGRLIYTNAEGENYQHILCGECCRLCTSVVRRAKTIFEQTERLGGN